MSDLIELNVDLGYEKPVRVLFDKYDIMRVVELPTDNLCEIYFRKFKRCGFLWLRKRRVSLVVNENYESVVEKLANRFQSKK